MASLRSGLSEGLRHPLAVTAINDNDRREIERFFYTQSKNLLTYIYIYKNDTIGSMIGVATLNGLLTYNNIDTNGYN